MLEKKIITDRVFINTTGGVTFEELTLKYNKQVEKLKETYENVHDIIVCGEDYEYNDGENYEQVLRVSFKRLETDDEYKRRVDWFEYMKEENAKGEKAKLVNYTHLKEGASCFNDNTCITISRNVEALSPQALISVVPTVLY